jgi:hypothetical protein
VEDEAVKDKKKDLLTKLNQDIDGINKKES